MKIYQYTEHQAAYDGASPVENALYSQSCTPAKTKRHKLTINYYLKIKSIKQLSIDSTLNAVFLQRQVDAGDDKAKHVFNKSSFINQ